jgi:hypothetical protein
MRTVIHRDDARDVEIVTARMTVSSGVRRGGET